MRSGDEPAHARSPLRLRLALAGFGLACWSTGAVIFSVLHDPVWSLACAVGACVAVVNVAVVVNRIRSGPHWQPGPGVPPYRPVEPSDAERAARVRRPPRVVPIDVRMRRYLELMGVVLVLLLVDWTWLWRVSMPAAMTVSLVAMLLLPIAAAVANAGALRAGPEPATRAGAPTTTIDPTQQPAADQQDRADGHRSRRWFPRRRPPATGGPWRVVPPSPRS